MSVSAEERHTKAHPCPVCGGHQGMPSGKGVRCAGYSSLDGKWCFCSRVDEGAHHVVESASPQLWAHLLKDDSQINGEAGGFTLHAAPTSPVAASRRIVAIERAIHAIDVRSEAARSQEEYEADRREYDALWDELEALHRLKTAPTPTPAEPAEVDASNCSLAEIRAPDLANSLGPVPWLCQSMRMAPGPVTLIAGEPGSGKTYGAQAIVVSVVSGQKVFGIWEALSGRVAHFDYEQGLRLTHARYQELGAGAGIDWREIGPEKLWIPVMPTVYMTGTTEDVETWCRLLDGYQFALIDSFRRCCRVKDENAADAARPLEGFWRVSEKTGCTIAMTHHYNKGHGGEQSDAQRVAGSNAILGMTQDAWGVSRQADKTDAPSVWTHIRSRFPGSREEAFQLQGTWASQLGSEIKALTFKVTPASQAAVESRREKDLAALKALLDCIRDNPMRSGRTLAKLLGRGKSAVADDLAELENQNRVHSRPGPRSGKLWSLV